MARKAFEKISDGLTDALAYAEGDKRRGKAHEVKTPEESVNARESEAVRRTLGRK